MPSSLSYLCICFSLVCILYQETSAAPPRSCSGDYQHGARVERGRYWYECNDGQLLPKGCLADDDRRVELWDSFVTGDGNYKLQCIIDSQGYVSFTYKACVYQGRDYYLNDKWEDNRYWYVCRKDNEFLRMDIGGCLHEGRRVDVDEKVIKGSFVYQCKKTVNGTCSMCPVGCYKEGRQYDIGDTFDVGDFWYTCTKSSEFQNRVSIRCIGCVHEGTHLKASDRFYKDDIIYECAVNGDSTRVKPAGCVTRDEHGALEEKRLDCTWVEGTAPYQYEVRCEHLQSSDTAVKIYKKCNYELDKGTFDVLPGCYRIVDRLAVGCVKDETDGRLHVRSFQVDDIAQLHSLGLRFC